MYRPNSSAQTARWPPLTVFQNFGCQFFLATKYDEIHVVPDDVEEEDYVLTELAGEPHENPTISSLDACKGVRKRHALDGIFKRFSELLSW